ncbi:MAG: hypothetical protein HYV67_02785 [Candidatus Taylorbacteria bacterium]|nr:hypothetical protein [Candidatus Taylorbacteria bacterium]
MLSAPIERLIQKLKRQKPVAAYSSSGESFINVHKLTEKAGAAYEKLRYLIDYKDERHIRRSAIERIIKRKILLEGAQGIGLSLIQELIAGRYLPNNAIAENAAADVEAIIFKYKKLESAMPGDLRAESHSRRILVRLMASEIEAFFHPNNEDDFVADAFYETVKDSVKVETLLSSEALEAQIIIACYRSLFNTDDETLFYKLWLKQLPPHWSNLKDETALINIGEKSLQIWNEIRYGLEEPLSFKLLPKLYDYGIYFSIIRGVVRTYGSESERILGDSEALRQFARQFLEKNYKKQYMKARGSAFRAVFYIFLTKILLALAFEVPYQTYFLNNVEYAPIVANLLFHPILLVLITVSVRPLGESNTNAIIAGVNRIIAGENIKLIKVKSKGGNFLHPTFLFLYAVLFLAVFGIIVSVLKGLNWSIVSISLFLCFLALVSYFALRIRHSANKWKVAKEEDRVFTLAFNLFALPILRAGKWLSRKFSAINLFAFVLDFIIETPFKFLLQFSDAFVSFLKEKQEDVY